MSSKLFLPLIIVLGCAAPASAQQYSDEAALAGWIDGPATAQTAVYSPSPSRRTSSGNQGLAMAVSSAPMKGTHSAPGNFALRQLGKNSLPPTRLNRFAAQGGEAVFGGETDDSGWPRFYSFTNEHRLERAMEYNPDLTTNHKGGAPSAWDYPQ